MIRLTSPTSCLSSSLGLDTPTPTFSLQPPGWGCAESLPARLLCTSLWSLQLQGPQPSTPSFQAPSLPEGHR